VFGVSQLSYIERRLQWLIGKQGDQNWEQQVKAIEGKGKFSSHTWGTFISNFIIDFGRIGALIACFAIGFLGGLFFNKFKRDHNALTVVRQCLICAGAVFSIQYSPFSELIWAIPLVLSSFLRVKVTF
jgi:hypothetical protein